MARSEFIATLAAAGVLIFAVSPTHSHADEFIAKIVPLLGTDGLSRVPGLGLIPGIGYIPGVMLENDNGGTAVSVVTGAGIVEAPGVPDPNDPRDHTHDPYYGHGQFRLELGGGSRADGGYGVNFGMTGDLNGGRESVDLDKSHLSIGSAKLGLHAGFEPVNMHFSSNTSDDKKDYIVWVPSETFGLQLEARTCYLLADVGAGVAVGTLGDGTLKGALTAGGILKCKGIEAAGEYTHLMGENTVNLGAVEFKRIQAGKYANSYYGVRVETIDASGDRGGAGDPYAPASGDHETRVMVTAGTAVF
jgi:hypothetical protein